MWTIQDQLSADVKDYARYKQMMAEMGERIDRDVFIIKHHKEPSPFIGFKLNKEYFDKAQRRIDNERRQLTLF